MKFVLLNEAGAAGAPASGGGAPAAGAAAAPAAAAPAAGAAAAPAAGTTTAPAAGDTSIQQGATLLGDAGKPAADAGKPAEVSVADQRKYLTEKTTDAAARAALAGKSDAEIATMFAEAKLGEVAAGYEAALKLPDGFTLDKAMFGKFAKIAAKAGLDNAAVQEFMGEYVSMQETAAKAPYQRWQDTQKQWRQEIANDKEIGGANLDRNLALAKKFVDSLPNAKEVRAALDFTGAGNNPAIVRAFIAAGKIISEGGPVSPGSPRGQAKSAAAVLYPTMAQQGANQ